MWAGRMSAVHGSASPVTQRVVKLHAGGSDVRIYDGPDVALNLNQTGSIFEI